MTNLPPVIKISGPSNLPPIIKINGKVYRLNNGISSNI
jgi:hypothetical protein